jgi:hypothetical protein
MALVAERVGGLVELSDGWRLRLPNECMCERNADGSWSVWDASHTVDVHIVTVAGTRDGKPMDAAIMLGRVSNVRGTDWMGHVEELVEGDEHGPVYRFAIAAAAVKTRSCRAGSATE